MFARELGGGGKKRKGKEGRKEERRGRTNSVWRAGWNGMEEEERDRGEIRSVYLCVCVRRWWWWFVGRGKI